MQSIRMLSEHTSIGSDRITPGNKQRPRHAWNINKDTDTGGGTAIWTSSLRLERKKWFHGHHPIRNQKLSPFIRVLLSLEHAFRHEKLKHAVCINISYSDPAFSLQSFTPQSHMEAHYRGKNWLWNIPYYISILIITSKDEMEMKLWDFKTYKKSKLWHIHIWQFWILIFHLIIA